MNIKDLRFDLSYILHNQKEDIITPYLMTILDDKNIFFKDVKEAKKVTETTTLKLLFLNNEYITIDYDFNDEVKKEEILKLLLRFKFHRENILLEYFESFNISDENKLKVAEVIKNNPELHKIFISKFDDFHPYFYNEKEGVSHFHKFKMIIDTEKKLDPLKNDDNLVESFLTYQYKNKNEDRIDIAKKILNIFYDNIMNDKYASKVLPEQFFQFIETPQFQDALVNRQCRKQFKSIIEHPTISYIDKEVLIYHYYKELQMKNDDIVSNLKSYRELKTVIDNVNSLNPFYRKHIGDILKYPGKDLFSEVLPTVQQSKYDLYDLYKDTLFKGIKNDMEVIFLKKSFSKKDIKIIDEYLNDMSNVLKQIEIDLKEGAERKGGLKYNKDQLMNFINNVELMEFLYNNSPKHFNLIFDNFSKVTSAITLSSDFNLNISFNNLKKTSVEFQEEYMSKLLYLNTIVIKDVLNPTLKQYLIKNSDKIELLDTIIEQNDNERNKYILDDKKSFIKELKIISNYNSFLTDESKIIRIEKKMNIDKELSNNINDIRFNF